MLKSIHKQVLIIFVFSYLLQDYLTFATLISVFLGGILSLMGTVPSKTLRTVATLLVFVSYWFTYGKVIDPEVGLNFLTTVIVLKLLEKEGIRDSYMIFFGLILLLSAGTLFEKNLTYVFFFTVSFFTLIKDLYSLLDIKVAFKELGLTLLWVLPITVLFFVFMPRVLNPMSFKTGAPSKGEVGYTPEVNVSQIESLSSNDSPVFQASVNSYIPQDQLYWRGNTLSFTDGWNWPSMPSDQRHSPLQLEGPVKNISQGLLQTIHLYNREEYFFALDHGLRVFVGNGYYDLIQRHTLPQHPWRARRKYEVTSSVSARIKEAELVDKSQYTNPSLSQADIVFINQTFIGQSVPELRREVEAYFLKEGFTYSLSPGRIKSLKEFLMLKKTGLCSHYASALAVIMRAKGIPSRLVSGFLGGKHNRFAGSYLITQNDAHVWVEAYHDEEWLRIDPTAWIAPDRIILGGDAFIAQETSRDSVLGKIGFPRFSAVQDLQQWFGQWDMKFYAALEDIDYQGQEAIFGKLKFKKEWFYTLAPFMMALFVGIYALYLMRAKDAQRTDLFREAWVLLKKKAGKRGLELSLNSISESDEALKHFDHPDSERLSKMFEKLVLLSFKFKDEDEIKKVKKEISSL